MRDGRITLETYEESIEHMRLENHIKTEKLFHYVRQSTEYNVCQDIARVESRKSFRLPYDVYEKLAIEYILTRQTIDILFNMQARSESLGGEYYPIPENFCLHS